MKRTIGFGFIAMLALAGCGHEDNGSRADTERAVRDHLTQRGVEVTSVDCPSHLLVKAGPPRPWALAPIDSVDRVFVCRVAVEGATFDEQLAIAGGDLTMRSTRMVATPEVAEQLRRKLGPELEETPVAPDRAVRLGQGPDRPVPGV